MGLRINSNIAAMNAYRNLATTDKAMKSSLEKLSSGLRINKAADDAAGLSISQGLQAQIGGLNVAARNAQDGINVVQTADGALNEVSSILQRMRDLSVQAANSGSQDSDAQGAANTEFGQLKTELDRIAQSTKFGSQSLLNAGIVTGTAPAAAGYKGDFQVDASSVNANSSSQIQVDLSQTALSSVTGYVAGTGLGGVNKGINGFDSNGLGLSMTGVDLTNGTNASKAIDALDNAIKSVSTVRATLGAYQNRFEHTINNINVAVENLSASKSAITDTDMALEMTSFSKSQILTQAGTAMLAQANQSSQGVLKLLG